MDEEDVIGDFRSEIDARGVVAVEVDILVVFGWDERIDGCVTRMSVKWACWYEEDSRASLVFADVEVMLS
jgi:hypothetical protein